MGHDFGDMVSMNRPLAPCGETGIAAPRASGVNRCRCDGPGCRCRPDRNAIRDPELDDLVKRCLCRILSTLPPDMAEILRRAEIEGQCSRCIARGLGLDLRTVRSRLRLARVAVLDRLMPWVRAYLESGSSSPRH